jgi:hypothetical protein
MVSSGVKRPARMFKLFHARSLVLFANWYGRTILNSQIERLKQFDQALTAYVIVSMQIKYYLDLSFNH